MYTVVCATGAALQVYVIVNYQHFHLGKLFHNVVPLCLCDCVLCYWTSFLTVVSHYLLLAFFADCVEESFHHNKVNDHQEVLIE